MQYQVFVQHPSEQQFIASIVSIPSVIAEGQTKAEAIAKAKAMLEEKLAIGEFVTIEVEADRLRRDDDPWIEHCGIFADDPTFDDFLAEIAAYRQRIDAEFSFVDSNVITLDPACGTGTYILTAIKHGLDQISNARGAGMRTQVERTNSAMAQGTLPLFDVEEEVDEE